MDALGLSCQNDASLGIYAVIETITSRYSWSTQIPNGYGALVCIIDDGSSTFTTNMHSIVLTPNGSSNTVYLEDFQFISKLDISGTLSINISEISGRNPSPLYRTTIGVVPLAAV